LRILWPSTRRDLRYMEKYLKEINGKKDRKKKFEKEKKPD